jgi:cell division protein FtsB
MSAPTRPGAPRSSARSDTSRTGSSRSDAARGGGVRMAPPARPGQGASSTSVPKVRPAIQAAPARGSLAAVLSWRTLVLAAVLGLAFALVWPSVRVYLDQRAQVGELRAERDTAQTEVDDLTAQLGRWNDPAFVVAQARERLAYVFPGETPYRVVDPEVARPVAEGSVDAVRAGETDATDGPWYDTMWESIQTVGEGPKMPVVTAIDPVRTPPPAPPSTNPPVELGG